MSIFSKLFRKKQKPESAQEDIILRSKLYLDILSQYEQYEQQGLVCIAPLNHRITVSQQLAALFSKDAACLQSFLKGLALYGIYQYARVSANLTLAKAELEAIQQKQKELGRELSDTEQKLAKMQAYADSDASQIINRNLYFDIAVVSPDQQPVVIARVADGNVTILSVQE